MIIYARELVKTDEPFSFIADNGTWIAEADILTWLIEQFGDPGDRWTYYYLIDYFEYPDTDYPDVVALAADVAWDFDCDEDAMHFKLVWG